LIHADQPPGQPVGVRDVGWIRDLLKQNGIPFREDELPLVAEVYEEYERLGAAIDAIDLPSTSLPALTLGAALSEQAP
jgi:hypothetical protein